MQLKVIIITEKDMKNPSMQAEMQYMVNSTFFTEKSQVLWSISISADTVESVCSTYHIWYL